MANKTERNVHDDKHSRVQRRNGWVRNKRRTTGRRKLKPLKCLFNFLVDYCNQSSLHGLRYIVEPGTHWMKRLIWAFFFTLSVIYTVIVISRLSARFQAAQTSTVVETTNYPVSNLPFPSVTLCPSNRVDWQKALEMEKDIVPTHDPETVQTYRELVTTLSGITFGDFDRLGFLKNRSLQAFQEQQKITQSDPAYIKSSGLSWSGPHFFATVMRSKVRERMAVLESWWVKRRTDKAHLLCIGLNLTNFLQNVAPTSSELLSNCWWRDSDRDCGDIFELQRTEYGFCYSFNSATSDTDEATYSKELRPRRSSLMGDWSGIRFTVQLNKSNQSPKTTRALGVTTFVGHPNSWPSIGRSSTIGMLASISVQCPSTYATNRVLQLAETKLPCQPDDGTNYTQEYCFTLCKRKHIIRHCGCNPTFMMPAGEARDCTVEDLICLADNNALFNTYYILRGNPFFPNNNLGMDCSCPVQCTVYRYEYQITHTALGDNISRNTIRIDVHYESSIMMRYRMDIVHTPIDLLVSFGGVVGLFLGGSLLSVVELVYHLIIGLIGQPFRRSRKVRKPTERLEYVKSSNKPEHWVPTVNRAFPLLDYYPNPRTSLNRY